MKIFHLKGNCDKKTQDKWCENKTNVGCVNENVCNDQSRFYHLIFPQRHQMAR